jgi:hypothetical protein
MTRKLNTRATAAPVPTAPVEIRQQDGSIDEIIIRGGSVHIERMSNSGWFMGVEASDGSYWQFWFGAKNGRAHVEFRHTEMTPSASMLQCNTTQPIENESS